MKTVVIGLAALYSVLLAASACSGQGAPDFASQVDPFIGTSINPIHDSGNTLPGAVRPFGMLYWSPDNVQGAFYRREDRNTRGFSLTHLSGPGCGVYGDVPILPMAGIPQLPQSWHPAPYRATYDPNTQRAEPGYYGVRLDSGIGVELAAGMRSGIARLQFPADGQAHSILVDLSRNLTRVNDAEIHVAGGLPGNDDLGATSSWAVFAAWGIYPEIPGVGGVTVNSPMFPNATLLLADHRLQIRADGAPGKLYIQALGLDGYPVQNWWIEWEKLKHANVLEFALSDEPNHRPGDAPPSFPPH